MFLAVQLLIKLKVSCDDLQENVLDEHSFIYDILMPYSIFSVR